MQYSKEVELVLERANVMARQMHSTEVRSEHVLFQLSVVESDAKNILNEFGLTKENLGFEKNSNAMRGYSRELEDLIRRADSFVQMFGQTTVTCTHLLLAILSMNQSYAYGKISYHLKQRNLTPQDVYQRIIRDIPNRATLDEVVNNPSAMPPVPKEEEKEYDGGDEGVSVDGQNQTGAIPYGLDLTEKAYAGGFDPVIGRDEETARVIQTLTRRTKNNPVLVGEAGVGKTAVVEGLAIKLAKGHVPAELQGKRLVELDLPGMLAGTRYRGDFEERLKRTINTVISAGDVILFIDEIHNLVGAGGSADRSMDAAEILKPALARGQLQIVGATTLNEYSRYIESDPALERRFQPITVDEPSPEMAVKIVMGVRSKYEKHHGVEISDEAIVAAVQLSVRYITDRFLPDKAFDVIDEACSRLKINAFAVPQKLVKITVQLNALKRKKEVALTCGDTELAEKLTAEYNSLYCAYEVEQKAYQSKLAQHKCRLTANDVREVISQMTGVPVTQLSMEERERLVHLEEELQKRVVGQSQAVKVVARAVRRQRAGLKDPNKPIGSFIFVGPTGVGKTELTKALAESLFGGQDEVVRIDMSEYMDKQSTAKLIGAPPGYVGYEERGYLTEQVRRKPYSVVLFDEIEKAHPDVFNLLLQILDEGRLTDSHGKTVDFKNTVVIMTSNIGISEAQSSPIGFGRNDEYTAMRDNVERALKNFFRPEFLNRVDEIVVFNYLNKQEILKIAELLCFNLHKRLKGTINLKFTQSAIEVVAAAGFDKEYGARPLKRTIQRKVEDALAEKILEGEISPGDSVIVDAQGGEIVFKKVKK